MNRTTSLIAGLAGLILATPDALADPWKDESGKGYDRMFMTIAALRDGCDRGRPKYRPDIFHSWRVPDVV